MICGLGFTLNSLCCADNTRTPPHSSLPLQKRSECKHAALAMRDILTIKCAAEQVALILTRTVLRTQIAAMMRNHCPQRKVARNRHAAGGRENANVTSIYPIPVVCIMKEYFFSNF